METQPTNVRARREIFGLLALCLLIGGVLFFIVRWREAASSSPTSGGSGNFWQARSEPCRPSKIALSPTGSYLAGICRFQNPPEARANSSHRSELVVWGMGDGRELSRMPLDHESGSNVYWASNEQFIGLAGRFTQVFRWKSKKLVNNPVARMISGGVGDTDLDVDSSWLDMDGDVKVQSLTDGELQAFRISTGAPILIKWRWRRVGDHDAGDWEMTLCPSKPGGPLHAIISQQEPRPRLQPTPVPTPTPTPVLSTAQLEFLEKEKALFEEVSQIVEKLQGEEPPSEEEAARLEARARSINARMRIERDRLFPVAKLPEPRATSSRPDRFAHVMRVDLKSGRVFWKKRIPTGVFLPSMMCSPDGAVVAILGAQRQDKTPGSFPREKGLEFWSAKTGATIGSTTMTEEIDRHDTHKVHWLPGRVLFVNDGGPFIRHAEMLFLNAHGASIVEKRPAPKLESLEGIAVSADGLTWAFSSRDGWFGYTDAAFQAGKEPFVKYQ